MIITSVTNEKVKQVAKLQKSASERRENALFVVEGLRLFMDAPVDRIHEVYYTEAFYERLAESYDNGDENEHENSFDINRSCYKVINGLKETGKAFLVSDNVLRKMSDTVNPQGILALVSIPSDEAEFFSAGEASDVSSDLILLLEDIQDPGNMGTIIRMAEGAGVTDIYVSPNSADIYSPKVVRSTMGSIFRMKLHPSADLIKVSDELKDNGVVIFAAHLNGKDVYDEDFTGPTAFLIGNEGKGLTRELSEKADRLIRIPMNGKVESLNAAMSSTILCYEALRQRRK